MVSACLGLALIHILAGEALAQHQDGGHVEAQQSVAVERAVAEPAAAEAGSAEPAAGEGQPNGAEHAAAGEGDGDGEGQGGDEQPRRRRRKWGPPALDAPGGVEGQGAASGGGGSTPTPPPDGGEGDEAERKRRRRSRCVRAVFLVGGAELHCVHQTGAGDACM